MNKVFLLGNLTCDPELSYLPSQTAVVKIDIAVNRQWKDKDGNRKEDVCFVQCKSFGKQAETINQYFQKGRPILIEGRLNFGQWEGKDGKKRSKHTVMIESFHFVGGKSEKPEQPKFPEAQQTTNGPYDPVANGEPSNVPF